MTVLFNIRGRREAFLGATGRGYGNVQPLLHSVIEFIIAADTCVADSCIPLNKVRKK